MLITFSRVVADGCVFVFESPAVALSRECAGNWEVSFSPPPAPPAAYLPNNQIPEWHQTVGWTHTCGGRPVFSPSFILWQWQSLFGNRPVPVPSYLPPFIHEQVLNSEHSPRCLMNKQKARIKNYFSWTFVGIRVCKKCIFSSSYNVWQVWERFTRPWDTFWLSVPRCIFFHLDVNHQMW